MKQFSLNEEEEKRAKEFISKHSKSCEVRNSSGFPVGPLFSYTFTPTGIGTGVSIKCSQCGEELDLTDYKSW